jgi:hypothetical protein
MKTNPITLTVTRRTRIRLCIANRPVQGRGGLEIPRPGPDEGFICDGTICGPRINEHERYFSRLNCDYRAVMYIRHHGSWWLLDDPHDSLIGLADGLTKSIKLRATAI